jgi:hypothetical protein
MKIENVKITDFAKRHFDSKFGGTKILDFTPEDFERILITNINTLNLIPTTEYSTERILPGYADFCKLVVVKNFTNARTGTLPITLDNYQYLRTGFSSRTEKELPVMDRWFDLPFRIRAGERKGRLCHLRCCHRGGCWRSSTGGVCGVCRWHRFHRE